MSDFDGKAELQKAVIVLAIAGIYVVGGKVLQLIEGVGSAIVKNTIHKAETRGQELAMHREMQLEVLRREAEAMGVDTDLVREGYNALVVRQEVTVDEVFRFAREQMDLAS